MSLVNTEQKTGTELKAFRKQAKKRKTNEIPSEKRLNVTDKGKNILDAF